MPHEDATVGHTYPDCAFNKVANEDFCRRTSAVPAHNHHGKCSECQCSWRRCSVCIVQREEGEPNPVKEPGTTLCAFHTEHGIHSRRANTKAMLVAKAGLPGWDLGLDVKLKLTPSASVMPDEDLRRPVPPMTAEMRRLLNSSDDNQAPADLAEVFRSEAFVAVRRQNTVRANASHRKNNDEETTMPATDMILDTDTKPATSKTDHSAEWAIMRLLNEGEKIVIHGVAYSFEMKKIDDLLIKANVKAPASEIMWELFRKFDLLSLGSERKMREKLGWLRLVFLEEVREGTIVETDHDADNDEEEHTGPPDEPDARDGSGAEADEDSPAQAGGKANDSTPRQPTEQKAMSDSTKRALAARISGLTGKRRALANSLIAGDTLEKIAKDYIDEKAASVARSALFKALEFAGHGMSVDDKVAAMQEAAPYVTAEPEEAGPGKKSAEKAPKAARAKKSGPKGHADGDVRNVPVLLKSAAPAEMKSRAEGGNGHAVAYELPVTIDLRGLGHFENVDVQATTLGLEHADERAKQIKRGRAAGFEAEHILMHPALPAQFLFVKRS